MLGSSHRWVLWSPQLFLRVAAVSQNRFRPQLQRLKSRPTAVRPLQLISP